MKTALAITCLFTASLGGLLFGGALLRLALSAPSVALAGVLIFLLFQEFFWDFLWGFLRGPERGRW